MFAVYDTFEDFKCVKSRFKFDFSKERPKDKDKRNVSSCGPQLLNRFRHHLLNSHGVEGKDLKEAYPFFKYMNKTADKESKTTGKKRKKPDKDSIHI